MSRIVRNSVLNGMALGVTSVLSLVLLPILIGQYGLEAYGLVPLMRLLTPLGAVGVLLLGLPQMAMRAAGLHSARGEIAPLQRSQSTLVAAAAVLGVAVAAVLLAAGPVRFSVWLNVKDMEQAAFSTGFVATALLLPLLMPASVVAASLSGLGRFRALRVAEVTIYLLYFAAAAAAARLSLPVVYVVMALLAADALRATALLVYAQRTSLIQSSQILMPDFGWLAAQKNDFAVISSSSLLGYARKHLAAASIVLLFGPSALGLYDAVERIPRALKTLLGLVNTAVLPHTMRLDAASDEARLRLLLMRGTRLTLLFTLPAAIAVMAYAALLISVWLGERLAYGGAFLVLLMLPFVLDSSLSLVTTASLSRLELISRQNVIAVSEIAVFLAAFALLSRASGETTPYAATAIAALTGYTLRLRVFLPAYGLGAGAWLTSLAKVAAGSVLGCGLVFLAARLTGLTAPIALLTLPAAVCLGAAVVVWLWNSEERRDLGTVVASLRSLVTPGASR